MLGDWGFCGGVGEVENERNRLVTRSEGERVGVVVRKRKMGIIAIGDRLTRELKTHPWFSGQEREQSSMEEGLVGLLDCYIFCFSNNGQRPKTGTASISFHPI